MGNASGKNDDEGTSGEGYEQEGMEFAAHVGYHTPDAYVEQPEPMLRSPPPSPRGFLHPPQIPTVPLSRSTQMRHVQNYAFAHNQPDSRDALGEKVSPVMITWSYGGMQVAVTGSWDNWDKRERMQRAGKDFVILKMLPSGVFHYRFLVDEHLRYAPDLPWECDDSGTAYNILDVQGAHSSQIISEHFTLPSTLQSAAQEDAAEAPESLSEFEIPPSPESSYNNVSLDDNDFSKQPPDIPPQLQRTLLNYQSSTAESQSLPRPQLAVLNHLYIRNSHDQPVSLGATHRFLQKYVTVILYKPSRK